MSKLLNMTEHTHDHAHDPAASEQVHLVKVISAFAYYKTHSTNHNHRRRRDYYTLSERHKQFIPDYLDKINQVDECIKINGILVRDIVKSASMFLDQGCMTFDDDIQVSVYVCAPTFSGINDLSIATSTKSTCSSYGYG